MKVQFWAGKYQQALARQYVSIRNSLPKSMMPPLYIYSVGMNHTFYAIVSPQTAFHGQHLHPTRDIITHAHFRR